MGGFCLVVDFHQGGSASNRAIPSSFRVWREDLPSRPPPLLPWRPADPSQLTAEFTKILDAHCSAGFFGETDRLKLSAKSQ